MKMIKYTLTVENQKTKEIKLAIIHSKTAQDAVNYYHSYCGEYDVVKEVIRGKGTVCTNWK